MHILIKKLHCFFSQKDYNLVGYIWKTFKVILKMVYKYSCIWNEEVTQKLPLAHIQFRSVAQWCPTLCESMDWSTPGFPVHHQLPEPVQTHVHRDGDAIQPYHPLLSPSPPDFNLPASGSFPMSQFFASDGQSIGVSPSAWVLQMNIQDWFPLGLNG